METIKALKKGINCTFLLFLCMTLISGHVEGNGDDTTPALKPSKRVQGKGEFWFRVRKRDHMFDAKTWLSEVRTYPASGDFPNVKVEANGTIVENSDRLILKIRGIEVPPSASDFNAWHAASEREEERYDGSMHHTWKLLSAAETCVIVDPKDVGGVVEGKVFVVIGGVRLNLGDALVYDGFAMKETQNGIDWRLRIPREHN